jgi:hypothetical protein
MGIVTSVCMCWCTRQDRFPCRNAQFGDVRAMQAPSQILWEMKVAEGASGRSQVCRTGWGLNVLFCMP